ncbi:MAG: hypothetical protein HY252_14200 [Sphingobacteriales bacterium]|nr:hypothetical protein [Sphingobacteriales bacterium]
METSNLIALGALLVAILGLIPQFHQMFSNRKSKKILSQKIEKKELNPDELNKEKSEKAPMPYMLRILMLVIFAVGSFLIEIIVFSIVAYFFKVNVDLTTMPLIWKIIFYSLFFIPGVFLFLAFLTFVANTED